MADDVMLMIEGDLVGKVVMVETNTAYIDNNKPSKIPYREVVSKEGTNKKI